jgi:hypothetical protein
MMRATWYKAVGSDDHGVILIGGRWVRFRCLYCARRLYPEVFEKGHRWQGPPTEAMTRALDSRSDIVILCEGSELHNLKKGEEK